jgi:hypothetical protein
MCSVCSTLKRDDTSAVIGFNYQFHTLQIDFIASPLANKQIDAELPTIHAAGKQLFFKWESFGV